MECKRVVTAAVMLWALLQMVIAFGAWAEEPSLAADVSAGAVSAIATLFALPVRLAACVATVAIGGTAYGLTMGTSEALREQLVAGTKYTCGGKFYITPREVRQFAREPEQQR